MKKLTVLVPVYNEKNSIRALIQQVKKVVLMDDIEKEIIIVDDGSTDGTRKILDSIDGCKIILQESNRGKGFAIRTGLKHATGDYVIIQDADLEYDPNDYNKLLNEVQTNGADAVYGSRRLNESNEKYSGISFYVGGVLVTWFTNFLYDTNLTDEPTCYKLIKTELLKSFDLECEGFEFCPEVTAKLALNEIPITEVPISYYPRHADEGKKITWADGFIAFKTLWKFRSSNVQVYSTLKNALTK